MGVIDVIITNFFSSSDGFIIMFVIKIGKLEEVIKSFSFEKMGESSEFVERFHLFDFNERNWHSSGFPGGEFTSEHINSGEGFHNFSASGNKDEGGITSFIM